MHTSQAKSLHAHPAEICLEDSLMTCYFRHLKTIFQKAGIAVTPQNKRQIDKIIHTIVNVEYKNCPATWQQVKKRIAEDETEFVATLKNAWSKQ